MKGTGIAFQYGNWWYYFRDIWRNLSQYGENWKYTQAWTDFRLKLLALFCFRNKSKFHGDSELRLLRIYCNLFRAKGLFYPQEILLPSSILNMSCFSILCPQQNLDSLNHFAWSIFSSDCLPIEDIYSVNSYLLIKIDVTGKC